MTQDPVLRTPGVPDDPRRRSVFWRVAAVLVGVQMLAVLLAVSLSAWFAYDGALDLAATGVRIRLDVVADEIERSVYWGPMGLDSIPDVLRNDLSRRFPDPVSLIGADGTVVSRVLPFGTEPSASWTEDIPGEIMSSLPDSIVIARDGTVGWAYAPLFDDAGYVVQGLVVHPLSGTFAEALGPTTTALLRAVGVVLLLVLLIALALAAFVTWQLVRPVRAMISQVEAVGRGDFSVRLKTQGTAEFDRLANAIHAMADEVAASLERLRATDRMRRELVANVGHDLRTPLAAIAGRIEEASRHLEAGDVNAASRQLSGADAQARYLGRLVADLFELSVLDTPDAVLRMEPVPVAELVSDAVSNHERSCRTSGIRLEAGIATDLPIMQADGVRLMRLLDNLMLNAEQHTPEGGWIRVDTSLEEGSVVIRVTDSGDGIPPERMERLFDRYYRGSDPRTRSHTGTGLGLAIARAIAVAHGGTLEAANATGGGAEFTTRLPVVEFETDE